MNKITNLLFDKQIINHLYADLERSHIFLFGEQNIKRHSLFLIFWKKIHYRALICYRLYRASKNPIFRHLFYRLFNRYSLWSGLTFNNATNIAGGIVMPFSGGLRIGAKRIGKNIFIQNNITIGNDFVNGRPVIGDNVFVGISSAIFGNITIGDNVIINPFSLVISDIPSNCIVAGNPAKVIQVIDEVYIQNYITDIIDGLHKHPIFQ